MIVDIEQILFEAVHAYLTMPPSQMLPNGHYPEDWLLIVWNETREAKGRPVMDRLGSPTCELSVVELRHLLGNDK